MDKITIVKECSDFLKESQGNPLVKYLPTYGSDIRKIKVRKHKNSSEFDDTFNKVFSEYPDLRQRCVFCNGLHRRPITRDQSLFYIFPINGYKYLYSKHIDDSQKYRHVYDDLSNIMENTDTFDTFSEVLEFDYSDENLIEGIKSDCEIIVFGIPYYYAVNIGTVKNYSTLFSL